VVDRRFEVVAVAHDVGEHPELDCRPGELGVEPVVSQAGLGQCRRDEVVTTRLQ
jgi:hypothetical protein